ncbi:MAG TPA: DegT/DnrJ/EryC1/StrS family aminotransferase [Thermodesulfobacteriota bacterium]|nr:DegT/DnrJ/EryC1/StrS family aminotransferase [Thermodesulfobacteriota bacterium]
MKVALSKPYVDQEIKDRVSEVIDSGQYILGSQCKDFEKEFAQFVGVKHAVLTSSGTSALFLCLKALGVKEGDGILVPSLTAFPTIEPVFHVGARPIFVDIDDTFTVDPKQIESILRDKNQTPGVKQIKGVIPVHLYGHPAHMDSLLDLAKRYGLFILEDCCQAHGARYRGARVGSIGIGGCFSFYPSKNLTVFGDGGILVTSNDEMAKTCRMLRDHGRREKYEHELVGYNLRFNEIQGAVGRLQLRRLDGFNESRRRIAQWYNEGLKGLPLTTPQAKDWAEPVYHLYVIQTADRDRLADFLKERGIQTGIHYPIPNHQQPAVRNTLGQQPRLAKTEDAAKKILSLPIYPELEKEKIDFVCATIREFFR